MTMFKEAWTEREFKRWMRPDAHRFLRPDWRRFWRSGQKNDPLYRLYESIERKYRPDQLRDDIGQFADEGGGAGRNANRVRLASADKPPSIGRSAALAIFAEVAKRAVDAFRSENGLYDLFKSRVGTVSHTTINGQDVFGSNSTSPMYYTSDRVAADALRDVLKIKRPNDSESGNIGNMPNNALYHAETTVLLRAARQNGGTLAGKSLDVYTDARMCNNCEKVLPFVGLELGNPTVTYVEPGGKRKTMRDGYWFDESQP